MSLSILQLICAAKSTIENLNVAKISQNVFRWCERFMFSAQNFANFVADSKIFYSRLTLPENFLLLSLNTVYQYLFNFALVFVLHKAG